MNGIVAVMAYINPGTGSLVWQCLLVGMAGAWVSVGTCVRWIKGRVSRRKSPKSS